MCICWTSFPRPAWKRSRMPFGNGEFREIQKRFDAMLEAIGKADEQKAFTFDLEETIGLKEYQAQWEYYHQGMLDCAALLKWMGVLA